MSDFDEYLSPKYTSGAAYAYVPRSFVRECWLLSEDVRERPKSQTLICQSSVTSRFCDYTKYVTRRVRK